MKSLRKDKGSGNNTDKFRRKLKRKRIYYSLLAVLFGIMLIPIAATGLGFQKYFYSVLYQNAVTENASKLEGAKGIMEENFHLLDQIALKIAISADMTPYAIGKDPLNAISQLTSFSGLSTFLDNIIVYYGEGEYFLTSHGMLSDSSFLEGYLKSDELYDTIVNAQEVMVYNANKFGRRQRWDHILYIVPLSIWAQREDGVCIFLLRTDALQKMVQASFSAPSDKMLIYDGHGELILSSGSKDYEYFSNEGNLFFDAANLEEIVYGDTEYVCSKTTSSRGYTYIWLGDKELVFRDVKHVTIVFICIIALALITDIIFIFVTMHKGYQPVESLLELLRNAAPEPLEKEDGDELATIRAAFERTYRANSEMRQSLQNNIPALREYFTLNAIQGVFRNREIFYDVCRGIDLFFEYPYFLVCCVYTGKSMAFGEVSPVQFSELMSQALPPDMQGSFHSGLEEGYSYGLLCIPSAEGEWVQKHMECFAKNLRNSANQHLLVSYGPVSREIDKIGRSSLQARAAMDYRFIMCNQTVISAADVDAYGEKNGAYPYEELRRLEQNLERWEVDEIFASLGEIMKLVREGNYTLHQAKCICYDIVSLFVKTVDKMNMTEAVEQSRYFDLFAIAEFSTIDELIETIQLLGNHISEFITVNLDEKQVRLSNKYIEYLYKNIGNYQFSTEMMAEHFGITSQYLRRQFRKETGQPVVEYFNAIRLEKAKELLVSTNMDIADIVSRIGYVDVSSFIRKFKARFGVTPGKFRELHQNKSCTCC